MVIAEGVIEPETPEAFREFALREALSPAHPSLVYLDSPGGNVVASMELGDEFRRLRVTAIVAGFAGGRSGSRTMRLGLRLHADGRGETLCRPVEPRRASSHVDGA